MSETLLNPVTVRMRLVIHGIVQGVGFRPFIHQLAAELGLAGWIRNTSQGVILETEGALENLEIFQQRIPSEKPPPSSIQAIETSFLDPQGCRSFEILESLEEGDKTAGVLPDLATCQECLKEISDPKNRRYRYPFTNCTHCGPRFTILEALPYDRRNTSMKHFDMCRACQAEYEDPGNRRFHAEPNACPQCGPHLELWDEKREILGQADKALRRAAQKIRQGGIVAVKGLGGFHLMVGAGSEQAVTRLRERKHREAKPLALMYPSLDEVEKHCEVSRLEEELLLSSAAPIVLLKKRTAGLFSPVAPGNPYLGVMLPYTPLHHLLMQELGFPVVATSGNLSEEPIVIDESEALRRLGGIADFFLVHNRAIIRHADDSIVRIVAGRGMMIRRARGYAPLSIDFKTPRASFLACGGHLKNTIAISNGKHIVLSQHIGDLESHETFGAFKKVLGDFVKFYEVKPKAIVCDLHPEYRSSQFAADYGLPVIGVQHHLAHIFSCMAENDLQPPALGVAWDGTGYGLDGTIWGGEFFNIQRDGPERIACFRNFPLPGSEQAVKEPRRTALALLYEVFGEEIFDRNDLPPIQSFSPYELSVLKQMLNQKIHAPLTSSAGRLFDAVSAILGLCQKSRFEAQAAMQLEFALEGVQTEEFYYFRMTSASYRTRSLPSGNARYPKYVIDWAPMIRGIVADQESKVSAGLISAKFHNTLVEMLVAIAERSNQTKVILSGGCFQNKYLLERSIAKLHEKGFQPYWHQHIPPNDGGIALGQIVAAAREWELKR